MRAKIKQICKEDNYDWFGTIVNGGGNSPSSKSPRTLRVAGATSELARTTAPKTASTPGTLSTKLPTKSTNSPSSSQTSHTSKAKQLGFSQTRTLKYYLFAITHF